MAFQAAYAQGAALLPANSTTRLSKLDAEAFPGAQLPDLAEIHSVASERSPSSQRQV